MIFLKFIKKLFYNLIFFRTKYSGPYNNWNKAKTRCRGYEDKNILNKVYKNMLLAKPKDNIFERDGVLVKDNIKPFEILNFIKKKSLNKKEFNIIDYGGSLGGFYIRNKKFLSSLKNLSWSIIEQKIFVDFGKKNFTDFSFYSDINQYKKNSSINLVLFSSSLQYLPNPYLVLKKIFEKNIKHIIIDRLLLSKNIATDQIYIQKNSAKYGFSSYPLYIFSEDNFISYFFKRYKILKVSNSYLDSSAVIKDHYVYTKTLFFELK
jgi:putative methyltransferase (TIGR04325 family)